ncbi:beta strand repeat-containing protein [Leifsonia sp. McL0607]|uniref:beta strand repeat-containing protein n=1 Tax=Leifsonia sp. McL0607 TaxID=3415672 RepID=UPI003CF6874F
MSAAGDTITYTFHVTNTGNVPINNIAIQEGTFSGTGSLSPITCTITVIAPAGTTDCTATYQATQADIDSGQITNDATVTGDDPTGDPVTSTPANSIVTTPSTPALTLTKTANPTTVTAAGQNVVYTFQVSNTGNTTITSIGITETAFTGTGTLPAPTCVVTTLAPGESTQCTTTYTTTAADLGAATIDNTAVATGQDPSASTVTSPDASAVVTVTPAVAALTLTKTANPTSVSAAGDTITYTFHVTNTGNVPINNIAIQEGTFSGTGSLSPITCTITVIAPAGTTDCTATYQATQADIDSGQITNDATVTGDDPTGDPVTSTPANSIVTTPSTPALTLTKTVSPTTATTAGQTVTYSFLIENTGNTTITNPTATEVTFTGTGPSPVIDCPTGVILAPGDSTICTAPYTLTQADIDTGHIDNTAVATGTDTGNNTVTSNDSEVTLTTPSTPALTLTKTANPTTVTAAGQNVVYTFHVSNTGNTTVTAIAITETAFTGTGTLPAPTCDATTLAPGESTQCTTTYTTTAADLGATRIDNTAAATGQDPSAATVTSPDASADVTVTQPAPALELTKTANPTTVSAVGDTITYTFHVTNTGNVTLTDVTVAEQSFSGTGSPLSLSCPANTTLDAGQSLTCTADYQTTAADIAAGSIVNTADATGVDPAGDTVTASQSRAVVQVASAGAPTPPSSGDQPLAKTGGSSIPTWLAPLAGLLAIAGIGLSVIVTTRTRNRKNAR